MPATLPPRDRKAPARSQSPPPSPRGAASSAPHVHQPHHDRGESRALQSPHQPRWSVMPSHVSLLSPLHIRHLKLRNRIFSSGHGTGFGVGGTVGERHIAYHRERARGGLALIVTEATGIDDAPLRGYNIRNDSDT